MADERPRRNTRQRQVIWEELQKLHSHPTAVALYAVVRRRLSKISLGTVYRNLELLARTGAIRKLDFGGEAHFDGDMTRHDHLHCTGCGRVDDVAAVSLDFSQGASNDWCGYQLLGHRLELFGLCPECRRRPQDNTPDSPKPR
jgi:Fur family transcriptional regulator, ferric uptake regulator